MIKVLFFEGIYVVQGVCVCVCVPNEDRFHASMSTLHGQEAASFSWDIYVFTKHEDSLSLGIQSFYWGSFI